VTDTVGCPRDQRHSPFHDDSNHMKSGWDRQVKHAHRGRYHNHDGGKREYRRDWVYPRWLYSSGDYADRLVCNKSEAKLRAARYCCELRRSGRKQKA
jgi:hypothetical protein